MTLRAFVAASVAVTAGLASGCGHSTVSPSQQPVTLSIAGPTAIAPGQIVSFVATATMTDGTTQDYTHKVAWSASPASVVTINVGTGEATALAAGDVTITASDSVLGACCRAFTTRTVLPPNTYRLSGRVRESGQPVQGAAITVLSGTGVGLSALSDSAGAYRLYGVGGVIQVRFSKPGYDDVIQTFTATQNDVLDFLGVRQTGPIPSLAGTYILTLTADGSCPTSAVAGVPALPDDFRSPRSYAASVTQDGPLLAVTLTDSAVLPHENRFAGRIEPGSIEFSIGPADLYYRFGNGVIDGVAERVSPDQTFVFAGDLHAQLSGRVLVGRLDGALEVYGGAGNNPTLAAQCTASNTQVTLTPVAQPSRR